MSGVAVDQGDLAPGNAAIPEPFDVFTFHIGDAHGVGTRERPLRGGRLVAIGEAHGDGRRPVYGGTKLFQDDPHWRDLILFYEYFHGDNGAGLGASHQTGWTGLVARLIQTLGQLDAATVLEDHRWPLARPYRRLTAEPVADVSTAREARGVSEQKQPD